VVEKAFELTGILLLEYDRLVKTKHLKAKKKKRAEGGGKGKKRAKFDNHARCGRALPAMPCDIEVVSYD